MKVFVSHADGDKLIALPFVQLLRNGIRISDIFCSSTKGAIPNGHFFVQHILSELQRSNCTVSLLSPNYLKSQFCIAELGSARVSQFEGNSSFNSFIVPPTKYGDLSGMLFGVQSEFLDDLSALDGLCSKLGGVPTDIAWLTARNIFQEAIKLTFDERKAEALLSELIIHDFQLEPAIDTKIEYKSKIRVQMKNNTGFTIDVGNLEWLAKSSDVPLQIPQQRFDVLQLEKSPGWHKNSWENTAPQIKVPPGGVFRLWLGLHQAFSVDELRRRHEGQLLGTLTLRIGINGTTLTWSKRL